MVLVLIAFAGLLYDSRFITGSIRYYSENTNALFKLNLMIVKPFLSLIACLLTLAAAGQKSNELDPKQIKSLSIEELMEIEVTSVTKTPQKLNRTASAIEVITNEDIRNSGATTLPEALRLATSLQVAQVNASQWAISARGFNNVLANKLLVLVDGRVVYTPLYAGVFWDVQNYVLEDIDRIEVITGPRPILWGSNAVNGVINIISKSSKESKGLFVEALAGTETRGLGSVRYGGQFKQKLTYRIYGTGFSKDNTVFPDSADANDYWSMFQAGIRTDYEMSEQDNFTVVANLYSGRPHADGLEPVIARGNNILARWNHTYSPQSNVQLQFFHDYSYRDFRNGLTEKLRTFDLEGQQTLIFAKQQFLYGFNARAMHHEFDNTPLRGFNPADKDLTLFSAFINSDIAVLSDKIFITPGLRVEHHTYSDFQFQPTLRVRWHPNTTSTAWASVARAIRNPSRLDREFFANAAPGVPFIVGADFDPETVISYELGYRGNFSKRLRFSFAAYYNVYDKIRGVERVNPGASVPINFANVVEGNTYGAELSLLSEVTSWWRIRGGYNFLRKDLQVKSGRADVNNASAESNDPRHQFLLQSTIKPTKWLSVGTIFRYVDALPKPYVPAYAEVDLRLGLTINKTFEVALGGQNLLKKSHAEFIPSSPAAKHIERNLYCKVIARL